MDEGSENLVGHCGLFCSSCGLYQGRIKQAVEDLRKVISTYGFDKIALKLERSEPAFRHYAEFEKVLEAIDRFFDSFGSCPGCISGGGDPECMIRECCRGKSYPTCSECIQMDKCENLISTPFFRHRFKALEARLSP